MGYQFIHIESYARVAGKGKEGGNNLSTIAGEADRLEGNTSHIIATPKPPKILYGVSATKVAEMAEKWADESKDARGHKLRKDGLCLVGGVISVPDELTDKEWAAFKKTSYTWLKEKYGDRLKSIIEHTDEPFRHVHFYVIPRPGEKFEDIHQGKKAASEVKSGNSNNKKGDQNTAYKAAMEEYQNEFSQKVAMGFGLTKIGPGRRRLTRNEWNQEQKQAKFFASSKAQHRAARKKGYREGYQAGQEEAGQELEALGERAGTVLAAVGKAVFSRWHAPTQEADLQREKALKKAQETEDKLRALRVESEAKIKRLEASHQAEVDRLQRIVHNTNTDLHRLETKLADLAPADPNTQILKRRGLDK